MENKRAFPLLVLALTLLQSSAAVVLKAANNAPGIPGGNRFDSQIGLQYGLQTLNSATSFIWSTFKQSGADMKNVESILLTVESYNGVAYTSGDVIHMSVEYIAHYGRDVKFEFTGVMYNETMHVWQWNGQWQAPSPPRRYRSPPRDSSNLGSCSNAVIFWTEPRLDHIIRPTIWRNK